MRETDDVRGDGVDGVGPSVATDPVAGKTVAEILGEIVWLMTQDPHARDMPLSEVERLVMPAILLRQFHIRYASAATPGAAPTGGETSEKGLSHSGPDGSDGALQPVGADLFAMVAKADAGAVIGSTTDGTAGRTACPQPWAPATIHGWRAGPVRRVVLTVGLQGGGVSRPAHDSSSKAMS